MKPSLNQQILIGAGVGVGAGVYLNGHPDFSIAPQILYWCDILGGVFINLLKMILIPLIFTSISVGIANLRAHAKMQQVWITTFIFFISTMGLAVVLALIVVNIFKPGVGLQIDLFKDAMTNFKAQDMTLAQFLKTFLGDLFKNPIAAMANTEVLPTVVFAMLFGIGLVATGEKSRNIFNFLNELFEVIMVLVGWIMKLAPLGIMALLLKLIATQKLELFLNLGKFATIVVGTTLFHGIVVLPFILWLFTRITPATFFKAMRESFLTAFSTSSSSATMPVTLRCVEENLKIDKNIAGFVIPLGTTINMDGTAIYEATAAIFVANLVGIHLNVVQQLVVFFTSIVAAMGAPGIPSAGMVTMIMVLQSVGLPVEAIAILIPIDRPLDTIRTVVNVEGDAVGSCIVQKLISRR
jgi:Na+/H+-dicarboxylate symporter